MGVLSVLPFINPMVTGCARAPLRRPPALQPPTTPHGAPWNPAPAPPTANATVLCPSLQAWVFAALDDEEASALYYALAFIYALPYLANGFELDGFALLSLLICILHVQVGAQAGGPGRPGLALGA